MEKQLRECLPAHVCGDPGLVQARRDSSKLQGRGWGGSREPVSGEGGRRGGREGQLNRQPAEGGARPGGT